MVLLWILTNASLVLLRLGSVMPVVGRRRDEVRAAKQDVASFPDVARTRTPFL